MVKMKNTKGERDDITVGHVPVMAWRRSFTNHYWESQDYLHMPCVWTEQEWISYGPEGVSVPGEGIEIPCLV